MRPWGRVRHASARRGRQAQLIAAELQRHGLPVLPSQMGFSDEEFVTAVQYAPQTRPGRYTILEHLDLGSDAIRDAYMNYAKSIGA